MEKNKEIKEKKRREEKKRKEKKEAMRKKGDRRPTISSSNGFEKGAIYIMGYV